MVTTEQVRKPAEAVSTLRGAGVEVDTRRVGRFLVVVCILALGVAVVALFVSGIHKNQQLSELQDHGVTAQATVSGCQGLLGGSGSNGAGYTCKGTLELDGHHYEEVLPGNALLKPGTRLRVVTVPGDPALVTTVGALQSDHPSSRVFVLPSILLAVLVLMTGALSVRRHRPRRLVDSGATIALP